jgi:PadR family transcriptional regulator PadR
MTTLAAATSRFEVKPPRGFLRPAILLLLSERPGYGYALVPRLEELHLGLANRPAVYRALAQLERDGFVEASLETPAAGQARRVYRATELGLRILGIWMGLIAEGHDHLGRVLCRYQSIGTTAANLDGGDHSPTKTANAE